MKNLQLMRSLAFIGFLGIGSMAYGIELGEPAPNLYGRNLDGSFFRLSEVQEGRILINFFWVECLPCVEEMPELAKLEKQFPQVKFLAVHVEEEEDSVVRRFLTRLEDHPRQVVLAMPKVKDTYSIPALPYTVFIQDGVIDFQFLGYNQKHGLVRLEERLRNLH